MKKKILIAYCSMIMGGSTSSLLALMHNLDPNEYDIDLQLQSCSGPMLDQIPDYVNLLSPANIYIGTTGRLIKGVKSVLTGMLFKAWWMNLRQGKKGLSDQVRAQFHALHLSRKNPKEYDIAIGFLEGWPVRYIAYNINAKKKLGWLHSTFSNLAPIPKLEKDWMESVDHIVFVADDCRDAFCVEMPEFADKAVTIQNIVDSELLRKRAEQADWTDTAFLRFRNAQCFKLITVCRISISVKGLDRIIGCAKRLKAVGKEFLWVIVGDGEDMMTFREMIAQAEVTDCVIPVGSRMNPLPFIKEADMFCLLSRYEGKPMAITESMILGTPPLVTRYLSAEKQILHGVEGLVVDNEDEAAFSALLMCMEQPEIVQSMNNHLLQHEYGNREYIHIITKSFLW